MKITYHRQHKLNTCGPACMRMLLEALGIKKSEEELAKVLKTNIKYGTLQKNLKKEAWLYDLDCDSFSDAKISDLKKLQKEGYIVIVEFHPPEDFYHYAVIKSIDKKYVHLFDPWYGPATNLKIQDFVKEWVSNPVVEHNKKRWFIGMKK